MASKMGKHTQRPLLLRQPQRGDIIGFFALGKRASEPIEWAALIRLSLLGRFVHFVTRPREREEEEEEEEEEEGESGQS